MLLLGVSEYDRGPLELIATTESSSQSVSFERLIPWGESVTIDWGDDSETVVPINWPGPTSHVYTSAGTYDVQVSNPWVIGEFNLRDAKIGCVAGNLRKLTGMLYLTLYNLPALYVGAGEMRQITGLTTVNMYVIAHLTTEAGEIGSLSNLDFLTLNNVPNLTIAAGEVGALGNLMVLYLNTVPNVTIGEGEFDLLTSLINLTFYNVVNVAPAAADFAQLEGISGIVYQNSLDVTAVDALLQAMYGAKASYSGFPTLNIGGSNATPSGVYQAQCPPTTGLEWVYELSHAACTPEGAEWTISYTGGTAP